MASDEIAIQLSLDYLNSKKVHDKLVNAINDNDISAILDLVQSAYTQGRADALKSLDMKYHLVDFAYYCKLQEQQFHRQETATKYAEEYIDQQFSKTNKE